MYNMLIVDDEMLAVQAIAEGIDWSDLMIGDIFRAYDFQEAIHLLQQQRIDILITDIEMPERNGIELVTYTTQHFPKVISIITTGHANFHYAQAIIGLGALHYLLKPLDFQELKDIVGKAIGQLDQQKNVDDFYAVYEHSQKQWNQQIPLLSERLWQDVLNQSIRPSYEDIAVNLDLLRISVSRATQFVVILISIEHWQKELNARDEEIMEYAIRKAASEVFLASFEGQVLQDRHGSNVVLLFLDPQDTTSQISTERIREVCDEYIRSCGEFFHCSLSCYIGANVPLSELPFELRRLIHLEKHNVNKLHAVIESQSQHLLAGGIEDNEDGYSIPFAQWKLLLEIGQRTEFLKSLEEWSPDNAYLTLDRLQSIYLGFVEMFLDGLVHESKPTGSLLSLLTDSAAALKSIHHLKLWARQAAELLFEARNGQRAGKSTFVSEVILYIEEHLHEELTREQLSLQVHLNSAYLSRLFRKETGLSLSDYIIKQRMTKAKELLKDPDSKISAVAETVGYSHFSHFSKMFKKVVGLTPQEYRNGYLSNS
jgi:two-component system response regulator YesN